ncbi:glycosyltransferase, partial [candidate division WWE3 bacterium]|nr:glycosyltransferase [candidate division WWE3 bacterium]
KSCQDGIIVSMKVALVHDWLTGYRGGEKVLEALCEMYPDADIFTLVYKEGSTSPTIESHTIKTSPLQYLPSAMTKYRYYLPLLPVFVEFLNVKNYDLVISSSHAVAKNVRVSKGSTHISYIHTPMRYVWDMFDHYFGKFGSYSFPVRFAAHVFRPLLQKWDTYTAKRVNHFITNSDFVGHRVKSFYGRPYTVVYPPVDVDEFIPRSSVTKEDFYIIVSALVPYKKVDLAVRAFLELDKKLVIVGEGPEKQRLEKLSSGGNIEFTGFLPRGEMIEKLQKAKGFIYPQIEDFGITAIEAQAAGTPVLAYGVGGAVETVVDGETGVYFSPQTPEGLVSAIKRFEDINFHPDTLTTHAKLFAKQRFMNEIDSYVKNVLDTK